MPKLLKSVTARFAAIAALALVERLVPAIAAGLVAAGYELHRPTAAREAARRAS